MKFSVLSLAAVVATLAAVTEAHISFRYPCPRRGWYDECPQPKTNNDWNLVDYDTISPLGTHDSISDPICKHPASFAGTRPTLVAGQTFTAKFDVDVNHNGGSCQYMLSYDNGVTWVVFATELKTCMSQAPAHSTYNVPVTIPADAPSGKAVLNWVWNNNEGNRELYSSCADVVIKGKNGGAFSGLVPLFANYGPSSPLIKELAVSGGDYGKAYFDARKPITINVPAQTVARRRRR